MALSVECDLMLIIGVSGNAPPPDYPPVIALPRGAAIVNNRLETTRLTNSSPIISSPAPAPGGEGSMKH